MNQDQYHGADGPANPPARGWDPLKSDCTSTDGSVPDCNKNGIGLTKGYFKGGTSNFLYSENFFCDKSVSAKSADGCEGGAKYNNLPPGTPSANDTDPLYIIVPLYKPRPDGLQCPTPGYCVDHPTNVDLSRLSDTLDPILGTQPSDLENAPLNPHSHIVLTGNSNRPEWWPVNIIGVTNQSAYQKIINSRHEYQTAQSLASSGGGATKPIPTNVFLWFQTLPGSTPLACKTKPFPDVATTGTFCGDIAWLKSYDISKGYRDGKYHPAGRLTREAMAAFLYRLSTNGDTAPACTSKPFPDVPTSNPFCGAITSLKSQNIVNGYSDGGFHPTASLTRQSMAALLYRQQHSGHTAPKCTSKPFSDVATGNPFCGAITWLKQQMISTGFTDSGFHPTADLTRQAEAAFVFRLEHNVT